jgi:hypothetical protein
MRVIINLTSLVLIDNDSYYRLQEQSLRPFMFSDTADEDSFTQAKPEKGLLTRVFTKAVEIATIGLVAAVAWQVFLDPIFFRFFMIRRIWSRSRGWRSSVILSGGSPMWSGLRAMAV